MLMLFNSLVLLNNTLDMKKLFHFDYFIKNFSLLAIFYFISIPFFGQQTVYSPLYNSSNFTRTIDLSKPVGRIAGAASTTNSGGGTYTIPITLPSGINNLTPNLSLVYNSQSGNGIAGLGWNISGLSAITRSQKNIFKNGVTQPLSLTNNDPFSLDGQSLIPTTFGTNGLDGANYGTEVENYATIISHGDVINTLQTSVSAPEWFEVILKDGTRMEFGNNSTSKIISRDLANLQPLVLAWRINKIQDVNSNTIQFTYSATELTSIKYSANANLNSDFLYEVEFLYSDRADQNTSFAGGSFSNSTKLLDKILITSLAEQELLFEYNLNYGFNNLYSFLKEITITDINRTQLNSTIFLYGDEPNDVEVQSGVGTFDNSDLFTADFDADGKSDLLAARVIYDQYGIKHHDYIELQSDLGIGTNTLMYTELLPPNSRLSNQWVSYTYSNTNTFSSNNYFASNQGNFLLMDCNGDSRDDIVFATTSSLSVNGTTKSRLLNLTVNYTKSLNPFTSYTDYISTNFPIPYLYSVVPYDYIHEKGNFYIPGDFDGDGVVDYILILANGCANCGNFKAFFSSPTKNIFNEEIGNFGCGTNNYSQYATTVAEADKVIPIDIDGDGKFELLVIKNNSSYIIRIFQTSGATGYIMGAQWDYCTTGTILTKDSKIILGDFNGDRNTDLLVRNSNGTWNIEMSNGKNFEVYASSSFGFNQAVHYTNNPDDDKVIVADFNGDGKADVLHAFRNYSNPNITKLSVYYSKGAIANGLNFSANFQYEQYIYNSLLQSTPLIVGDFNGDGRADLLNWYNSGADVIYIKPNGKERILSKITDGYNETISFDYKNLTDYYPFYERETSLDDPSNAFPYNYIQQPLLCVSSINEPNGIGGNKTNNFSYKDAVLNRSGKGFLGFKKMITNNTSFGTSSQVENEINLTYGIAYAKKQKSWVGYDLTGESTFNYSFSQVSPFPARFKQELISALSIDYLNGKASQTFNTYDDQGNILVNKSFVGFMSGSSFQAKEKTITTTTYGAYVTQIPSKPMSIAVEKQRIGEPLLSKNTKINYNNIGLVTSKIEFDGLAGATTTALFYDNFGNVTTTKLSATGVNDRVTKLTYDATGRFIVKKEQIGNNVYKYELIEYDRSVKTPSRITTDGCNYTSFLHNGWGYLLQTILPDNTTIDKSLKWDVQSPNLYYEQTVYSGGQPDKKTGYDSYDRPVEIVSDGFDNNQVNRKIFYDERGNIKQETNNYYDYESPLITDYIYDPYNRLYTVDNPMAGTTANSYDVLPNGNRKITTQTITKTTSKILDAADRIVAARDIGGTLEYAYDSWGNQIKTIHDGKEIISATFDDYGRKIGMRDMSAGNVTYQYNSFGEMISQTDNDGHTTRFQYDDFGRLINKTGDEGITQYTFTNNPSICSNNQLESITDFNGNIKRYQYDNLGRLAQLEQVVDGISFKKQFSYNNNSKIDNIVYPSGLTVNYKYQSNGFLKEILVINNGISKNVFRANKMNGFGQCTEYASGNGQTSVNDYYFGVPEHFYTSRIQDLTLNFNYQNGNLLVRQDNIKQLTETFQYDDLERLLEVQGPQPMNMVYDNDGSGSVGNIIEKTNIGSYAYSRSQIHQLRYVENAAGIISHLNQNIKYTSFLKPEYIDEDRSNVTFTYDDSYRRIKSILKENNAISQVKTYLGDYELLETVNGNKEIHYINGVNGLCAIAVMEHGQLSLYYTYTDHLGSILTVTDESGNITAEQSFDAWGRARNADDWTYNNIRRTPDWLYRGFCSHEMLPQFGLINMNARLYDPLLGRMLGPDNFISNPYSTQALNRYAYANNNPTSYVDPDGNNPLLVIVIAAALIGGTVNGIAYNNNGGNFFDGFWRGAVVGGAAALTGGAVAGAIGGFGGSVLGGLSAGIVNGGLGATLNNGDIVDGLIFGALYGVVGGGVAGYFGGGAGALIGGATSGALQSAINNKSIFEGALVGGASSFALYHMLNYINYRSSPLKTYVNYRGFTRMGGDYQRAMARQKEFGGYITNDRKYVSAPASDRHSYGVGDVLFNSIKQSDIRFTFHVHWDKPNQLRIVDSHYDLWTKESGIPLSETSTLTTASGPGAYDRLSPIPGFLMDRSHFYVYYQNIINGSFNFSDAGISLSSTIYWPWQTR